MTIEQMIRSLDVKKPGFGVQFLHQCMLRANWKGAKKGTPAHTEVTFVTDGVTCADLLTGDPRKVAIIVWIPREEYDRMVNE